METDVQALELLVLQCSAHGTAILCMKAANFIFNRKDLD